MAVDFDFITPCGENCNGCEKLASGFCKGCIESDGMCREWEASNGCPIYKCAMEHNVKFCGLCNEFPCDFLVQKVVWNPHIVKEHIKLREEYKRKNND